MLPTLSFLLLLFYLLPIMSTKMSRPFRVSTLVGRTLLVESCVERATLFCKDKEFIIYVIVLPLDEFDVIL